MKNLLDDMWVNENEEKSMTMHQKGGSWERWNAKTMKKQENCIHKKPMYERMAGK
jgi:hypothetical protein